MILHRVRLMLYRFQAWWDTTAYDFARRADPALKGADNAWGIVRTFFAFLRGR